MQSLRSFLALRIVENPFSLSHTLLYYTCSPPLRDLALSLVFTHFPTLFTLCADLLVKLQLLVPLTRFVLLALLLSLYMSLALYLSSSHILLDIALFPTHYSARAWSSLGLCLKRQQFSYSLISRTVGNSTAQLK